MVYASASYYKKRVQVEGAPPLPAAGRRPAEDDLGSRALHAGPGRAGAHGGHARVVCRLCVCLPFCASALSVLDRMEVADAAALPHHRTVRRGRMGARRGVVGAAARIEGGAGAGARCEGGTGARALNHGPATGRRRINWGRPAMAGGGSGKGDTGCRRRLAYCRRRPASRAPSRQGFGRLNLQEFG